MKIILAQNKTLHQTRGSTMAIVLITITILAFLFSSVIQNVSNKYTTAFQVAGWQEALVVAESGADIAIAELRMSAQDPSYVWSTGWTPSTAGVFPKTYNNVMPGHGGEGGSVTRIVATIDTPASLKDGMGRQWFRVRSTGSTDLPGPPRVSGEKLDNMLRRLSLIWTTDKTTGVVSRVTSPRASRTIECIAKPATMFGQALMSNVQIKNDGSGLIVDSYDSRDNTKSNNGSYAVAYRQSNGDVASNSFPAKGDKTMTINIKNDYIFGDVGNNYSVIKGVSPSYFNGLDDHPASNTNPLIVTDGNAVPTGQIVTDNYRDLPRIKDPNWTTFDASLGTLDKKDVDRVVSSNPASPSRFVADKVDLSKDTWVVKLPPGATRGYAELWVKGDINLKDGGMIQVEPGVQLTVYFDHNIKIEDKKMGAGFDVQSDNPADLLLLGVEQPDKTKKDDDKYESTQYTPYKATGNISLKDADFVGLIYAPDHNLVIDVKDAAKRTQTNAGKGRTRLQSGVDVFGSFVARTINAKGPANIHYDEAANDVGPFNDYAYVSWYEDVNLDKR